MRPDRRKTFSLTAYSLNNLSNYYYYIELFHLSVNSPNECLREFLPGSLMWEAGFGILTTVYIKIKVFALSLPHKSYSPHFCKLLLYQSVIINGLLV